MSPPLKGVPRGRKSSRSVGRPPNGDPAKTRQRILEAAIEQFGRQGENGAALRQIAGDADVSMSTVMHHFGDKQGLFDACLDATYERALAARERFAAALAGVETADAAVAPFVRVAFASCLENRRFLRVVVTAAITTGRFPERLVERASDLWIDRLELFIATAVRRPQQELQLAAMSFWSVVTRYSLTSPEELARLAHIDGAGTDGPGGLDPRVHAALEGHLTQLLSALLGVPASAH